MKTLSEGYKYALRNHEDPYKTEPQQIVFIRKEPAKEGAVELETVHNGTTNEEVLRVLIHRLEYLDGVLPSKNNKKAIKSLKKALNELESRHEYRKKMGILGYLTNKKVK